MAFWNNIVIHIYWNLPFFFIHIYSGYKNIKDYKFTGNKRDEGFHEQVVCQMRTLPRRGRLRGFPPNKNYKFEKYKIGDYSIY